MIARSYNKIRKTLKTIKTSVWESLGLEKDETRLLLDLTYDTLLDFSKHPNQNTTETFDKILE